jgi:hypothetical protein
MGWADEAEQMKQMARATTARMTVKTGGSTSQEMKSPIMLDNKCQGRRWKWQAGRWDLVMVVVVVVEECDG